MQPETKYADSGGVNIAYQVVGSGTLDLIYVMGWVSNLDYFWEEPSYARFLSRLASLTSRPRANPYSARFVSRSSIAWTGENAEPLSRRPIGRDRLDVHPSAICRKILMNDA